MPHNEHTDRAVQQEWVTRRVPAQITPEEIDQLASLLRDIVTLSFARARRTSSPLVRSHAEQQAAVASQLQLDLMRRSFSTDAKGGRS
jgi:hypothetical protein